MKLLIIEDDLAMQMVLQRALSARAITVALCGDGLQAVKMWRNLGPDVVLLDLTLPGLDGLQVLSQARSSGLRTPVLILTARGTVGDRVIGLNTGADDYLAKPFDLDELEARLRALHRRNAATAESTTDRIHAGNLHYDKVSGAVYCGDHVMDLTPREVALLSALMHKLGHAVSKEQLFDQVFPNASEVQYEAVEVVVYRLRKKLAGTGVGLMTLRGLGYLLKQDPLA
ncbi:MAG: response regulator [Burkholderiaceae bacterium]|nr:response regulator [Burkholderiaceae bacterium]